MDKGNDPRAYIDALPRLRAMTDGIRDAEDLACFGRKAPSTAALQALRGEILRLSANHHKVSLIMADLKSASGVAYRSGLPMCAQSTVKAIYAGALLENRPEVLSAYVSMLREAVQFSANEPYRRLREIHGSEPLRRWCAEVGVDPGFADPHYPRLHTVRDMFRLWTKLYRFLNDDAAPECLGAWLSDSSASAARKRLGGRCRVHTKAGWECGLDEAMNFDPRAPIPARFIDGDPSNDECAINDTGVVYSEHGPYIFAIYTDHPFGVFRDYAFPNPLYDLTEALYAVHLSYHI